MIHIVKFIFMLSCLHLREISTAKKIVSEIFSFPICCSEIQLKSPNWLFGQRKYEDNSPKLTSSEAASIAAHEEMKIVNLYDLNLLSPKVESNEEDVFQQ